MSALPITISPVPGIYLLYKLDASVLQKHFQEMEPRKVI